MKNIFLITAFIFCPSLLLFANEKSLDIGLKFQKSIGLYYENGFMLQYSDPEYLYLDNAEIGFSYVSSRLGSAIGSNALKQDSYILNLTYKYFSFWKIDPLLRLNIGYFYSDYESDIFKNLDNSSLLFSCELGAKINTNSPLNINISLGYNFITGDGLSGAGSLYPVFYQMGVSWDLYYKDSAK